MKKSDVKVQKAKEKLDKWMNSHNVLRIKNQVYLNQLSQEEYEEYMDLYSKTLSYDELRKYVLYQSEKEINEFFDNVKFEEKEVEEYGKLVCFSCVKTLYKVFLYQEYLQKKYKNIDLNKLDKSIENKAIKLMIKNSQKSANNLKKCNEELECFKLGFTPSKKTLKSKGNPEFN